MSDPRSLPAGDAVAIIGIACRYPGGVSDAAGFWRVLSAGVDTIGEIPPDRMDLDAWFDPRPATPGQMSSRWGGYLEGLQDFDAGFFEMSPREAERLDPQQRLLLETAWEVLEDGGIDPLALEGSRTGVFVGQWLSDFEGRLFAKPEQLDFFMLQGSGRYASSGRLSYALGLRGPSLTLDTACSSSLTAVHLACRSLRGGECHLAIAGGVNVILQPHVTIAYSQSRMMGTAGRCRFGDASGDGYVRSEGAGLVLLKPLAAALADGDLVYAVIRGSAVNNDGRSSGSLGTPSRVGQEEMLREAYRDAGVDPAATGYSEAHGTGTRAGDPVELAALGAVLGAGRRGDDPCWVGSVKTNFGHTEGAAGVAGLIKASLALHHEAVPPSLHFEQPNPQVPWAQLPLRIPTALQPWPRRPGRSRVAGVSAFGIAGTNAHVVLEEAPPARGGRAADERGVHLLPLSARNPQALAALAARYEVLLGSEGASPADLDSLCGSAALRRAALPVRAAFVARDARDMGAQLRAFAAGEPVGFQGECDPARRRRVAFVFPGQGAQWLGMGRELLDREPVFREALAACDEAARPWFQESIIAQLRAAPDDPGWRLDRIDVIQPVLTALAIAYARLWAHWGVTADAVVGHSMGEVAAAHWAGALGLSDAMRVVCLRSALMQRTSGQGAMAVVDLPPQEAARRLAGREHQLAVAVSNGPGSCVVSGDPQALAEVMAGLEREQVFCRLVKVDVASHSPQMDPLVGELVAGLDGLSLQPGERPLYSTVDAAVRPAEGLDAAYWGRNLRQPVQFAAAVRRMLDDGVDTFVEIGPHPLLLGAVNQVAQSAGRQVVTVASGRRDEPEQAVLLQGLAGLWVAGHRIDWRRRWPEGAAAVRLPLMPWQRERHWCDAAGFLARPGAQGDAGAVAPGAHPYLQQPLTAAGLSGPAWQASLTLARQTSLADHRVRGQAVFPATAYLEAALAAAAASSPDTAWALKEVEFLAPLVLPADAAVTLQTGVQWLAGSQGRFEIHGRQRGGDDWQLQARGRCVVADAAAVADPAVPGCPPDAERLDDVPARLAAVGHGYGPAFQGLRSVRVQADQAWAELDLDPALLDRHTAACRISPPLLDAALQLLVLLAARDAGQGRQGLLPVRLRRLEVTGPVAPGAGLRAHARLHRADAAGAAGDVTLLDDAGAVRVCLHGVDFTWLAGAAATETLLHQPDWLALAGAPPTPALAPTALMVLAGAGEARSLAEAFAATGGDTAGEGAGRITWVIDPRADALGEPVTAWCRAQAGRPDAGGGRPALVSTLALQAPPPEAGDAWIESAWQQALDTTLAALRALQAAACPPGRWPRLWLVTAAAVAVGPGERPALGQAALWGLGRVLMHEHPGLDVTLVDLPAGAAAADAWRAFAALLERPPADRQLAWRAGLWRTLRVVPLARPDLTRPADQVANFQGWQPAVGTVDRLGWCAAERPAPGPGEVEVEVEAVGLNFLNLLSALGAYPGYPQGLGPLGLEAAGRVARCGPGVTVPAVGDAVTVVGPACLARYARVDARLAVPRPAGLAVADAAGLAIVFLTAWHALHHQARLQPGETVLVHSAAGGVGLAALQVARHLGARVLATAGTADKRAWLQAQGVADVFDSRGGDFADHVLQATGGRGVDVVLNALAGGAIAEGLRCLAVDGRFVEIGKRDLHAGTALSLAPFVRSLSYSAVDLDRMIRERPDRVATLLAEVMDRVDRGVFTPLPTRVFAADDLAEAFRALMPGDHIGKHVVSLSPLPSRVHLRPGEAAPVRADGCYLITGGLGALGREVAGWLARRGAGAVVLAGRRVVDPAADPGLRALQRQGLVVRVVACDVADATQVAALLAEARTGGLPLRGVVHAAGVLSDALAADLDGQALRRPRDAKVQGAWHLDRLTAGDPLDFTVYFSSVASLLGTPGQANYAAANAFLDALAADRQARGLRTLSLNLGPVAGAGLAAAEARRGESLARLGLDGITAAQAVEALDTLLAAGTAQAACMAFEVQRWHAATGRPGVRGVVDPSGEGPAEAAIAAAPAALPDRLRAAPAGEPRRSLLHQALRQEVAEVLRLAASRIPLDRPLKSLGMDSLMALELRNRLERSTGLTLSPTLVWNHPTLTALGEHLAARLGLELVDTLPADEPPAVNAAPDAEVDDLVAALAGLDDDEVRRLLDAGEGAS